MVAASGIVVVVIALCGFASVTPLRTAQARSGAASRFFKPADKLQDEINDLILPLLTPRRKSSSSKPKLQLTELLPDDLKFRNKPYVQLASHGKSGEGKSRDKSPLAIFVADLPRASARHGDEQAESADEDDDVSRDGDHEELDQSREAYYDQLQQHDKVLDHKERTADELEQHDASNELELAHDDEAVNERSAFEGAEDESAVDERAEDMRAVDERVEERAADERAEDVRAIYDRAEDVRAVDERAEDFRAVTERAEDVRAVEETAEDFRVVGERAEDVRAADERAEDVRAIYERAEDVRAVAERAEDVRAVDERAEDVRTVAEREEDARAAENLGHEIDDQTLDESLSTLQLLSQDIASALRAEQVTGSTEDRRQDRDTVLECVERRDSAAKAQEHEALARQAPGEFWNHYHAESRTGESDVGFSPEDSHVDPQKAYHLSFSFTK